MRQGHYFCETVKFCRMLKGASGLQLGQRIPVQVAVAGLSFKFQILGARCTYIIRQRNAHIVQQICPLLFENPAAHTESPAQPKFGKEQWRYGRGGEDRVYLMPQYIWPKLSFLQVAWLRHGRSLVCTSVWDSPPKRFWAQLFLRTILRLWAQAAASLGARNVDRKQVSHRARHTWTVLNPTHYTMM